MQGIGKTFSLVTQNLGYGNVAKLADVAYQTVSGFAADPRPGYKKQVRRRILSAVIDQSEQRVDQLMKEAMQLKTQIEELKQWRAQEFDR